MADRFDRAPDDALDLKHLEAKRVGYAAARIANHAARELFLLERAAREADDDAASQLEYAAGTAHRDCVALTEEHGLDGR
jgi:hypothetical protein